MLDTLPSDIVRHIGSFSQSIRELAFTCKTVYSDLQPMIRDVEAGLLDRALTCSIGVIWHSLKTCPNTSIEHHDYIRRFVANIRKTVSWHQRWVFRHIFLDLDRGNLPYHVGILLTIRLVLRLSQATSREEMSKIASDEILIFSQHPYSRLECYGFEYVDAIMAIHFIKFASILKFSMTIRDEYSPMLAMRPRVQLDDAFVFEKLLFCEAPHPRSLDELWNRLGSVLRTHRGFNW